jgi:hypothetical protein
MKIPNANHHEVGSSDAWEGASARCAGNNSTNRHAVSVAAPGEAAAPHRKMVSERLWAA